MYLLILFLGVQEDVRGRGQLLQRGGPALLRAVRRGRRGVMLNTNNNSQIIPSIRLLRGVPYVTSIQMGEGIQKLNRQLIIEFCKQRLMGSENPKISWTSYMEDPLY